MDYSLMIIIIFILEFTNCTIVTPCLQMIDHYKLHFNPIDPLNPFTCTGVGLNDLGKYDTCIRGDMDGKGDFQGYNGYFVYIATPIKSTYPISYVGVCLPKECINQEGFKYTIDSYSLTTFGIYNTGTIVLTEIENNKYAVLSITVFLILVIMIIYISFSCCSFQIYILCKSTPQSAIKNFLDDSEQGALANSLEKAMDINYESTDLIDFDSSYRISSQLVSTLKLLDFQQNITELFYDEGNFIKSEIKILDVIDGLSTLLLLFSYTCTNLLNFPSRNVTEINHSYDLILYSFRENGVYFINTIFILIAFRQGFAKPKADSSLKLKIKQILSSFLFYFSINAVFFLIFYYIVPFGMIGPLSGKLLNEELDSCSENKIFFGTFFFFSIFIPSHNCFNWSWIIACIMYLESLGHILCLIIEKYKSRKNYIFVSLICIGILIKAGITFGLDLGKNEDFLKLYKSRDYSIFFRNPACKIEVYISGLICGRYYRSIFNNSSENPRNYMPSISRSFIKRLSSVIGGILIVFYSNYLLFYKYSDMSVFMNFTIIFQDFLFTVGFLIFVLTILLTSYDELAHKIFQGSLLTYLGRMKFTALLFGPIFIRFIIYNFRVTYYYSPSSLFLWCVSFAALIFIMSSFITALTEKPIKKMIDRFIIM